MRVATVGFYFDGRMSKEGEYYVKYAVYFNGKQKYYSTGIKLDSDDVSFLKKYKAGLTGGVRDQYKRNLWDMIYGQSFINDLTGQSEISYTRKAEELIAALGDDFSFENFARYINSPIIKEAKIEFENNIIKDLKSKSELLIKSENLSDGGLFDFTQKSLTRFLNGRTVLKYEEITKDFLIKYQKWMLVSGKKTQKKKGGKDGPASITTVGIYIRNIRTIFNEMIADKSTPITEAIYPFGKNGYTIPSSRNIKKALTKEDITNIIKFQPEAGSTMEMSRDLWIFSYLCNGINFADIFSLKWADLDERNDLITFTRKKTEETKKANSSKIQIDLNPLSKKVIERWGSKSGEYIFPFYTKEMSAERKKAIKAQAIKTTNYHMKKIADSLEITIDVNTYAARHSFATILLQSEAPLAFISEKLGHGEISTTQKYLGSFEDKKVKKYLSALLPDETIEEDPIIEDDNISHEV